MNLSFTVTFLPLQADGQYPAEQKIPATDPYTFGECLRDLLDTSARLLRSPRVPNVKVSALMFFCQDRRYRKCLYGSLMDLLACMGFNNVPYFRIGLGHSPMS